LSAGKTVDAKDTRLAVKTALLQVLDKTAADHGVSRTVISLAWLLKHPSKIIPIIGSNNPANISDAAKADDVELSRDEWYRILVAARGQSLP
jgi:predicted oxidoreductase